MGELGGAAFEPGVCFDISLFCPAIFSIISDQPPGSYSFHTITPRKLSNHPSLPHLQNHHSSSQSNHHDTIYNQQHLPPRLPSPHQTPTPHTVLSLITLHTPHDFPISQNIPSYCPSMPSEIPPFGARSYPNNNTNNTDTRDCSQGPLTRVFHNTEHHLWGKMMVRVRFACSKMIWEPGTLVDFKTGVAKWLFTERYD